VRIWLLGGFKVSVGTRILEEDAWRLSKAANLVKLLALSPTHSLHREQVMDALWPEISAHVRPLTIREGRSTPPAEPLSLVSQRVPAT
jgi:hypothetical protein